MAARTQRIDRGFSQWIATDFGSSTRANPEERERSCDGQFLLFTSRKPPFLDVDDVELMPDIAGPALDYYRYRKIHAKVLRNVNFSASYRLRRSPARRRTPGGDR